jgi:cyclase
VIDWIAQAVGLGAGEILLTAVDQEGTRKGLDIELLRAVNARVNVPVITSGGFWRTGGPEGAPATLAHLAWQSPMPCTWGRMTVPEIKQQARALGVEVRL